jgi:hypothetical protein
LSFLETCDNHDAIADLLTPSAGDMTKFAAINKAYVEVKWLSRKEKQSSVKLEPVSAKIEVKSKKSKAAVLLGGLIGGEDNGVKEEGMNSCCACLAFSCCCLN